MVHATQIYFADTRSLSPEHEAAFLDRLPPLLLHRISKIAHSEARTASLVSLMLTERLLAAIYSHCTLAQLHYNSLGKPLIDERFAIGIAHSGSIAVVAGGFAPRIGIDIEQVVNTDAHLYKEYFSAADYKQITSSTNPGETLLRFWTRKEAILKAAGVGVLGIDAALSVSDMPVLFHNNNYYVSEIQLLQGYIAAIALPTPGGISQVTAISLT